MSNQTFLIGNLHRVQHSADKQHGMAYIYVREFLLLEVLALHPFSCVNVIVHQCIEAPT